MPVQVRVEMVTLDLEVQVNYLMEILARMVTHHHLVVLLLLLNQYLREMILLRLLPYPLEMMMILHLNHQVKILPEFHRLVVDRIFRILLLRLLLYHRMMIMVVILLSPMNVDKHLALVNRIARIVSEDLIRVKQPLPIVLPH